MRKTIPLLIAAVAIGAFPISRAGADTVCNELACVSANEAGYLAVVDGAAPNPDPADGYVVVEENGTVCVGSKDGPYSDTTPSDGTDRDPNEKCGTAILGFDPVCFDVLCFSVRRNGYLVVVDGAAANPDPTDGYVLVEETGSVCIGSKDGPYSDTTPLNGTVRDPNETCSM